MESFKIENLTFRYPAGRDKVLSDINVTIKKGEFILICGKSGCGKTTLLRLLKPVLSPFGELSGKIYFEGRALAEYEAKEQASAIGFVMQNPGNQIVTDKVWHELAFGLESLGYKQNEIRARVSEMASFFGIETWFYKNVSELSGGQKQLLNLASVMAMQPSVLILDEPTSQLDPIAAGEFLNILEKINREFGTTVILTEHRLEEAFPLADRVIVMDEGKIIAADTPEGIGSILKAKEHDMYKALPTPMKIHAGVKNSMPCPLSVREGRAWLNEFAKENELHPQAIPKDKIQAVSDTVLEVKDVWFRYEKDSPDIVKGLNLNVRKGELFCLVAGNGTGKTTTLSLISGLNRPYRGEVLIKGQSVFKIKCLYNGLLGVLPQNPQSVFVKKNVYLDLLDILSEKQLSREEKKQKVYKVSILCRIENLLESHPYDLSGGEQQRVALAKTLLMEPEILLLDEPTKGMDAKFKEEFAKILSDLTASGVTVLMVSHDIEFCAEYADRCALMFDGSITSVAPPRAFFKGKSFYTTSANRMARACLPDAVLAEDVILACGGSVEPIAKKNQSTELPQVVRNEKPEKEKTKNLTPARIIYGSFCTLIFVLIPILFAIFADISEITKRDVIAMGALQFISLAVALSCFFPSKGRGIKIERVPKNDKRLRKRTLAAIFLILILIPVTLYIGVVFWDSRKYYFTSFLIIMETMIPFFMAFESRKPKARELVIISVLCAITVAGRAVFYMLPEFKPVVALVILAGLCFGGETGFLVGSISGFLSNFFFGQGPWTPWQMFAFGIIGFIAGILFRKGFFRKTKVSLCVFGFLATFIIYGGIMNPASIIMWQSHITWNMIAAACLAGMPMDLVHALGTAFFMWFMAEPMIETLERIKVKYGLMV